VWETSLAKRLTQSCADWTHTRYSRRFTSLPVIVKAWRMPRLRPGLQ
jgi:hypothetical protein